MHFIVNTFVIIKRNIFPMTIIGICKIGPTLGICIGFWCIYIRPIIDKGIIHI